MDLGVTPAQAKGLIDLLQSFITASTSNSLTGGTQCTPVPKEQHPQESKSFSAQQLLSNRHRSTGIGPTENGSPDNEAQSYFNGGTRCTPVPKEQHPQECKSFSAQQLLSKRHRSTGIGPTENGSPDNEAQSYFNYLLRETCKSFGLWENPPTVKDIPATRWTAIMEQMYSTLPQLRPFTVEVRKKIVDALQNRRYSVKRKSATQQVTHRDIDSEDTQLLLGTPQQKKSIETLSYACSLKDITNCIPDRPNTTLASEDSLDSLNAPRKNKSDVLDRKRTLMKDNELLPGTKVNVERTDSITVATGIYLCNVENDPMNIYGEVSLLSLACAEEIPLPKSVGTATHLNELKIGDKFIWKRERLQCIATKEESTCDLMSKRKKNIEELKGLMEAVDRRYENSIEIKVGATIATKIRKYPDWPQLATVITVKKSTCVVKWLIEEEDGHFTTWRTENGTEVTEKIQKKNVLFSVTLNDGYLGEMDRTKINSFKQM